MSDTKAPPADTPAVETPAADEAPDLSNMSIEDLYAEGIKIDAAADVADLSNTDTGDVVDIPLDATDADLAAMLGDSNPAVQAYIKKQQAAHTAQQTAMATQQAELTAAQETLKTTMASLNQQQTALLDSEFRKDLQTSAEGEPITYDELTPGNAEKYIEQQLNIRMNKMLKHLEDQQVVQQEQAALVEKKARYQSFVDSKPEFKDETFRTNIGEALRADPNLKLETAYWAQMGRQGAQLAQAASVDRIGRREASAQSSSGFKKSGDLQVPMEIINDDDPMVLVRWLTNNS